MIESDFVSVVLRRIQHAFPVFKHPAGYSGLRMAGVSSGNHEWFTASIDLARDVMPYGHPLQS